MGAASTSASASAINSNAIEVSRKQGRTLYLLEFYLTDYVRSDIAEDYLALIRKNLQVMRDNGAKALIRFAYSNGYSEKDRPWDATEEQVLRHVAQIKPILQEYGDVIYVMQAGFVGSWGEWYYTENFKMSPITAEDYLPRKHLLDALLDALPQDRQIEVRTPAFKMKIYGYALADTLTAAEAHMNTVKARIGGHNDCFLASANDTGTFNTATDREYWIAETKYTIMGGESCGLSQYCHCEDGERYDGAMTTLEKYHFSYLHIGYHPDVLKRWKKNDCYNQIVARLGYRLVMQDLFYSSDFAAGKPCELALRFYNTGFAAPMNPRNAKLIWISSDGTRQQTDLGSDPRTWHPGWHVVKATFTPGSAKGTLYLALQDPLLPDRPEYSIALANEGVFDSSTGYNKLFEVK